MALSYFSEEETELQEASNGLGARKWHSWDAEPR
jgi:hypothetical protein